MSTTPLEASPEQPRSLYQRYRRPLQISGVVLLAGFVAAAAYVGQVRSGAHDRQTHALERLINDGAAQDGFTINGYDLPEASNGEATVQLGLGNCSLDNVDVKYTKHSATSVDVTGYSFSGYALSQTVEQYSPALKAPRPTTEGEPVTFSFKNMQDLQANILGPDPCKTLALTYTPGVN